jgi:hypothetical protein
MGKLVAVCGVSLAALFATGAAVSKSKHVTSEQIEKLIN